MQDGFPLPSGTVVHPDGSIDEGVCVTCGRGTFTIKTVEVEGNGGRLAWFQHRSCSAADEADETLAWWRRQFDRLMARGWDRGAANVEIIRRMDLVARAQGDGA